MQTPFFKTTHILDDNEPITKIKHSHLDHTDYKDVMDGKFKEEYSDDHSEDSNIIKCYCFFRKALKEKGIDVVRKVIWEYLTHEVNDDDEDGKYLVIIELGTKENEQAIFDTINTAA